MEGQSNRFIPNNLREETEVLKTGTLLSAVAVGVLAFTLGANAQDKIKVGFATHVQGNPFIQQIIDGAQAAAKDLDVELVVSGVLEATPRFCCAPCKTSSTPASRVSQRRCRANPWPRA